jgi:ComF family protein
VRPLPPPLCRTCGDPLPSWRVISTALDRCARCRRRPHAFSAARAAGEYDGTLRDILQAFKYGGRRRLSGPLGRLAAMAGAEILIGADCAVPVPLHPLRRLYRGFNQAEDLARQLGLPVVCALRRTQATAPQTGLTAAARWRNVGGAFSVSPFLSGRAREQWLVNRTVVLVDDVRTTGATLDACARILLTAGVREVRALTVARAAPPARVRTGASTR